MTAPDSVSPETLYEEGRQRLARGQVERACESFCRVLEMCPEALDDVAAAFGDRDQRGQAIAATIPRGETSTVAAPHWALAARLARDLARLDDALHWAQRAIEMDPACATWWYELGEVQRARDEGKAAAIAFRRCLQLDPDHSLARSRLAMCRRRRGKRLVRAMARLRPVRRLVSRFAWGGGRADILESRADSAAAVHQMRWAHALEEGGAMPLFWNTPEGVEPEKFAEHWPTCQCVFWRFFLAHGMAEEIRTVIDVGCGTGCMTEHFVCQGHDVTGVTCNPHERDECQRRGIRVIEEDFHFLSVPDETFDLVFSSHSLEHSIAPVFALLEWKRVLRPGGYMLIDLPVGVEQDARAVFRQYYDETDDMVRFPLTGGDIFAFQEACTACCTYGGPYHVFVLTYWQLRWLFQLTGLDLVAEGVEEPVTEEILGVEYLDGRRPRDRGWPLNGLFLLRKSEAGRSDAVATAEDGTKTGRTR